LLDLQPYLLDLLPQTQLGFAQVTLGNQVRQVRVTVFQSAPC